MEDRPLKMTLIKQKDTEREEIPEGPEVDEETWHKCMNFQSAYAKHDPDSIFKGVYCFDNFDDLHTFLLAGPNVEECEDE